MLFLSLTQQIFAEFLLSHVPGRWKRQTETAQKYIEKRGIKPNHPTETTYLKLSQVLLKSTECFEIV